MSGAAVKSYQVLRRNYHSIYGLDGYLGLPLTVVSGSNDNINQNSIMVLDIKINVTPIVVDIF